jgi:hypothetical protein
MSIATRRNWQKTPGSTVCRFRPDSFISSSSSCTRPPIAEPTNTEAVSKSGRASCLRCWMRSSTSGQASALGVKTGPMMNEIGLFKAVPSTIPTSEYVYERLNAYNLSHVFLMRQLANLLRTPIAALAGDGVIHHFRKRYAGTLILNVGIDRKHGADLLRQGFGDLIAFGRYYIANPDLVERIRLDAPLNEQRPEGYYGSSPVGYTDYPFIRPETAGTAVGTGTEQTHV